MDSLRNTSSVLALQWAWTTRTKKPVTIGSIEVRILTRHERNEYAAMYPEGDPSRVWYGGFTREQFLLVISDDKLELLRDVKRRGYKLHDLSQLG